MLARAGEGSVRDAQSLLDQAIAHADGKVSAEECEICLVWPTGRGLSTFLNLS